MNYDKKKISLIIWIIAILIVVFIFLNSNKDNKIDLTLTTTSSEIKYMNLTPEEQIDASDLIAKIRITNIEKGVITSTLHDDKNEIYDYAIEHRIASHLSPYAKDHQEAETYVINISILESYSGQLQIEGDQTLLIIQDLYKQNNQDLIQLNSEYIGSFQANPGGYLTLTTYDKGLLKVDSGDPYLEELIR